MIDTISELPDRCDHPLQHCELLHAHEHQTSGGAYVADAIVRCNKCGAKFHMCSDHNGSFREHQADNILCPVPILKVTHI